MKPVRLPLSFLLFALLAVPATAAEIVGQVRNGTTGQPAAGVTVDLQALQRGLQTVGETTTDANGRFRLQTDATPNERFLVQVPFQGVNYNAPAVVVGSGPVSVDITVFESGADPKDISITEHVIFLDPRENQVLVTEAYIVTNQSNPPRSYAPDDRSFVFGLPDEAGQLRVSIRTQSGMPLNQQSQPLDESNTYYLSYALRPDTTQIQVSYEVPSSGNDIRLILPLPNPARRQFVVIPSSGVELRNPELVEQPQSISPDRRIFALQVLNPETLELKLTIDPETLTGFAPAGSSSQPSARANNNPVTLIPQPLNESPRQFYALVLMLFVLLMGLYYLYSFQPAGAGADEPTSKHRAAEAD